MTLVEPAHLLGEQNHQSEGDSYFFQFHPVCCKSQFYVFEFLK